MLPHQGQYTPDGRGHDAFARNNFAPAGSYPNVRPPQQRNYPPPPVPGGGRFASPVRYQQYQQHQAQMPPLHQQFQSPVRTPLHYQQQMHMAQQMQAQTMSPYRDVIRHSQATTSPALHPPQHQPAREPQPRVPRPKSADFLEYELQMQGQAQTEPADHGGGHHHGRRRHNHNVHQQRRPKSSIDSRMLSEEFWQKQNFDMNNSNYISHEMAFRQKPSNFQDNNLRRQLDRPEPPHWAQQSSAASQTDSNDEVSRYFPTPSPRKPVSQTPTMTYQNLPENAAVSRTKATATPNRLYERTYQQTEGDFKRSASARLHRSGRKSITDNSSGDNSLIDETSRKKEQVCGPSLQY